ncbi:MAG TPA: IS1595 family transposase [Terriglobia bacterium]|nr:IS1595 family transposase [Terriglobia bacterium]
MTKNNDNPKTLLEAVKFFSDFEHCRKFMVEARWTDGVVRCPRCDSEHVTYLSNARVWKCYGKHERPKFSLKVGTIFADSPIPLEKWLPTVWLLANSKNGISSYEVGRALGVTQKTAWFMMHRIRKAMQHGSFLKLDGEVEIDETFIGGKARNMHVAQRQRRITGTGGTHKTAVMGIVKRGGEVRTVIVPDRKKSTLQTEVEKNVQAGSALYSDDLRSYDGLAGRYAHQVVDHAVEYVNGRVHTNTLENFWSLLKRGIHGTYVSVEPFHLHRYLDEQTFRYNNRGKELGDSGRFALALSQIAGKRLTYDELIGKAAMEKQRRPC